MDQDTKKRLDEAQKNEKSEKGKDEKGEYEFAPLDIGSLELDPKTDKNPLIDRAYRVFLKAALNPLTDGTTTADLLQRTKAFFLSAWDPRMRTLFEEGLVVHEGKHPALADWIIEVQNFYASRKLDATYRQLYRIQKAYEIYGKTLDRDSPVKPPVKLLSKLTELLNLFKSFAHADSRSISIANQFYEKVPPLVRGILKKKYGFQHVDHDAGTKNMYQDLMNARLNDYRLLAELSGLTDFILDANARPEFRSVMTYERDLRKPTGNELMPLQRFGEIRRGLKPRPSATIEENLRMGIQVPTKRKRVKIPSGQKMEEDERITILLYDISGSMGGLPADFQAGLIASFTAQAISDISPSGKQRHRVVLIPFDHEVHTPTRINKASDAIDLIKNFRSTLTPSGGGTDIQKALLEGLHVIADAEKRQGEPLALANIILMTDGQSDVKAEELLKARNSIDRRTPIQTMFVSIGDSSNGDLIKFAQDSESFGFDKGYYREFSNKVMEKVVAKSQATPDVPDDELYFDQKPAALSGRVIPLLRECVSLAIHFSESVKLNPLPARSQENNDSLGLLGKSTTAKTRVVPIGTWLNELRTFGATPALVQNRHYFDIIVTDVYDNFKKLTGIGFEELSLNESASLEYLLKYAAGLSDDF